MINGDPVWFRGIRIQRFTLYIIKFKFFVTVLPHNYRRGTDNILLIWFVLLESFELIIVCKAIVIDIIVEMRIVFKRLMPSDEGITEMKIDERTSP